jgi:lytic murein transglycosylase
MRRLIAIAALLLAAGCAPLPLNPGAPKTTPAPSAPPPPAAPQPAPPPSAPGPAQPIAPTTASGDMIFDAWAQSFYPKAVAAGISPETMQQQFSGLTPDPRVAALDSRQPEFSKPISQYISGVVTEGRGGAAPRKRAEVPQFDQIEQGFGVPKEVLMGVWAMESGFGAIQGDYDVVRSLATLAAQGRRRAWAEHELIAALTILQSGEVTRGQLKGSWAGAMGQTQLIPSMYLTTAIDADGDGRRDIWASPADALASAANLLSKAGWRRGQSWAREVTVPADFDWSQTEGPKLTPTDWAAKGVARADGLPWNDLDASVPAQLVAPAGANGPVFLLFPNHFVIRQYNNSIAYALAVGMLADRFAGMGGLVHPWPQEQSLSLADRMTAQRALAALGFDPGQPDGVVGLKTRQALRAWQKSRGVPADGYLSLAMVQRLVADTQPGAAPAQTQAVAPPDPSGQPPPPAAQPAPSSPSAPAPSNALAPPSPAYSPAPADPTAPPR